MILARTVYGAYPEAEALDIDPPEDGESLENYFKRIKNDLKDCGDTLFAFIMIELNDCLDRPVASLLRARHDLQNVIDALHDASNGSGREENEDDVDDMDMDEDEARERHKD